jgi:hypothetical protein
VPRNDALTSMGAALRCGHGARRLNYCMPIWRPKTISQAVQTLIFHWCVHPLAPLIPLIRVLPGTSRTRYTNVRLPCLFSFSTDRRLTISEWTQLVVNGANSTVPAPPLSHSLTSPRHFSHFCVSVSSCSAALPSFASHLGNLSCGFRYVYTPVPISAYISDG